jgi:hypothetical protein
MNVIEESSRLGYDNVYSVLQRPATQKRMLSPFPGYLFWTFLKIEAESFKETLIDMYQFSQRHISEDWTLYRYQYNNLKSCKLYILMVSY